MAAGLYDITNEILGKGHFAIVKLARHCLTGEHVAVKIVDKMKLTKEGLEQLSCEIKLWSILSRHEHPNVVKLYQCIDTRTKLYLVMEYCGNDVCDLYDHIQKKNDGNGLDEEEARQIFRQICQAIYYCHSLKIVHRDLKPENILIINNQDKNSTNNIAITVKLIDFGFSNQWCEDELLRTSCGSLAYSAPEILLGNQYDGPKVDIWALGCILYILLYGRNPFMQFNDNETLIKILDCSYETPVKSSVNDLAVDLIRCLLRKDPMTRSSIQELIAHPWMREKNHKLSNDFGSRKESRFKNFVNEHIIDQMITQGISVSKEMIKKILKNELIETVNENNETVENAPSENNNSTAIDHHYIKATYHLLKDKSNREFKGIDINQQLKTRQNKRGNITRKRDLIGRRSDSVDTGRMNRLNSTTIDESEIAETTTMTTTLSNSFINTQSLTNLEIPANNLSSQCVLPLARKCSIVSEEGSICNDDKGAQENSVNSLVNFHQKNLPINSNNNNLNSSNGVNTQSHSINIFVTDSSSNISKPVQIKSNDPTTLLLATSPARTKSDRSSILHPVSSSPDLKENLNEYYQSNNTADESGGVGGEGQNTTTNILFDAVCLSVNRSGKNHQNIIMNNKKNGNSNNVDKKNAIHVLNPSNSSEMNHYNNNQQSSLSTPSMRVIIQSKSLNNIAFLEHPSSDRETSATNNVHKSDGRNNGSKMINSLSTMNMKSSKTDKNDCCIIV